MYFDTANNTALQQRRAVILRTFLDCSHEDHAKYQDIRETPRAICMLYIPNKFYNSILIFHSQFFTCIYYSYKLAKISLSSQSRKLPVNKLFSSIIFSEHSEIPNCQHKFYYCLEFLQDIQTGGFLSSPTSHGTSPDFI